MGDLTAYHMHLNIMAVLVERERQRERECGIKAINPLHSSFQFYLTTVGVLVNVACQFISEL